MADTLTPYQRHINMAHIRSSDTRPEVILRTLLWRRGYRYRVNDNRLPGKPDVVFPKYRSVVFVHGCFWHGHNNCRSNHIPETNKDYWMAKIARNQERDQEVWRKLEAKGWSVIIVWECQLKKANLDATVARVAEEIVRNGEAYLAAQEERRKAREEYRQERKARKEIEKSLLEEVKSL